MLTQAHITKFALNVKMDQWKPFAARNINIAATLLDARRTNEDRTFATHAQRVFERYRDLTKATVKDFWDNLKKAVDDHIVLPGVLDVVTNFGKYIQWPTMCVALKRLFS